MTFPQTRQTLIARLASGGSEADWQHFLQDYWGPIVQFAARIGSLPVDQAEDLAAEMFVQLLRSPILLRWQDHPTGKLRSLLCGVVRNLLSNRRRVEQGRRRLLAEAAQAGGVPDVLDVWQGPEPVSEDVDQFYRLWVNELLAQALRQVREELHAEGRGDYFRALYGRVCEGLSAEQIGQALGANAAAIENHLRVARARLTRALGGVLRQHVERYSPAAEADEEFAREWSLLGSHLESFGGLEEAIRHEAAHLGRWPAKPHQSPSFIALRATIQGASGTAR